MAYPCVLLSASEQRASEDALEADGWIRYLWLLQLLRRRHARMWSSMLVPCLLRGARSSPRIHVRVGIVLGSANGPRRRHVHTSVSAVARLARTCGFSYYAVFISE